MPQPDSLFSRRISRLEHYRRQIKIKRRRTALIRVLLFASILLFILNFAHDLKKPYYSILILSGSSLFYFLVRVAGKYGFFLEKIDSAVIAIHHEEERRARKKDSVYRDPDFSGLITESHFYQDLDLTGSQGLVKSINSTFTRQSEKLFLQNIFRSISETSKSIQERQDAIREISGKKTFLFKYLRMTGSREKLIKTDISRLQLNEISFFKNRYIIRRLYKFLPVLTWSFIITHVLTGIPLSSPAILVNLLVYAWYRKAISKELSRFELVFKDLPVIARIIPYLCGAGFQSSGLNNFGINQKKIAMEAYSGLEKISGRVALSYMPAPHFMLNLFFQWDIWSLAALEKWYKQYASRNIDWLDALVKFDALVPFALLKYRNQALIFPVINESGSLCAAGMSHPFLEHGVTNDLAKVKGGDITIITGSNMAGKTTYLRTAGINSLLALCGGPVAAEKFEMPWNLRILSSIRNSDSMEDGVSLFYAEVKRLAHVLKEAEDKSRVHLILLDEILKGTNSRERFIASKAVLAFLHNTSSLVFITTHDIELANLFKNKGVVFRHFAEDIVGGKMYFDYKIKDGIVNSSNALKIMELEGLKLNFEAD